MSRSAHSHTEHWEEKRREQRALSLRGRSHIAPKNAWKTLGALLSPFFQSARAVALRRRLSLLSNHQLRSPLQEGNFVTWPAVRLRHCEKLRCFYLHAARTRLEKTSASLPLWARIPRVYIWNNELECANDAICERPFIQFVLLCPALLTHTQNTEKRTALSLSPSVTQVRGFFPLTFRVSSASGLFFTLVCSTYLLTSRVLVNVGFVQTWCLVECDSRLCLSEIYFFFKPSAGSNQFILLHAPSVWHFLLYLKKKDKKGSSGIKLLQIN